MPASRRLMAASVSSSACMLRRASTRHLVKYWSKMFELELPARFLSRAGQRRGGASRPPFAPRAAAGARVEGAQRVPPHCDCAYRARSARRRAAHALLDSVSCGRCTALLPVRACVHSVMQTCGADIGGWAATGGGLCSSAVLEVVRRSVHGLLACERGRR